MAKDLFGGMTDYSHQSFDDIIVDANSEIKNLTGFISMIEDNVNKLKITSYWSTEVLPNFKGMVAYALKHYQTAKTELDEILKEIDFEVQEHHCKRLLRIAQVAQEINIKIGKIWHQEYLDKDYENPQFELVDSIYRDTRDMAVNLLDVSNIAERLKDFIGKKSIKVKMNKTKILFIASSPFYGEDEEDELPALRPDREFVVIDKNLQLSKHRDSFELKNLLAAQIDTISLAMMNEEPQIVHFTGHGSEEGFATEDNNEKQVIFSNDALVRLFSLFSEVQCVFFSSCYSNSAAKEVSKSGIYAVGMQEEILEDAANSFATGFYQAIGSGKNIEFAFQMGQVVASPHGIAQTSQITLWLNGSKVAP